MTAVTTYLVYLAITVPLTVWIAGILSRNGRVVLAEVFPDEDVARAVNQLLVMGFYLIGLGAVLLLMRGSVDPASAPEVLTTLSGKIGVVALLLGVLHLVNVAVLHSIRQHVRRRELAARPVPPPVFDYRPFPAPPVNRGYTGPVAR